jgi:two-component system sensor histidine kinase BarA
MKEFVSLRVWALAIIIAPTVIIGLLLGGYLTYKRYTELDQNLIERGVFMAEPLTLLSAEAVENHEQKKLAEALELAHLKASPIVKSISVFLPNHQLFVSSNPHVDFDKVRLKPGKLLSDNTDVEVSDDNIYVRSPIYGPDNGQSSFVFIKRNGKILYGYLVIELNRDRAELAQQTSIIILSLLLLLGLVVTSVIAHIFVRNIVGPIVEIKQTLKKVADGDLKARLTESWLGELDAVRQGVNALTKSIHVANERAEHNISEYTQELQQTVELLEVQNIQLNLARRDAQDANDVKSQFLANMSHELRTPLNGVLGFTRQLRKTPLNTNQKDFLDTIETSANNLLRIINDILDFSKLDADKMVLESISFNLRDIVNEVMSLIAPGVFDKGLEIHLSIDSRIPNELQGDPVRLKQILINLFGNAVKFTRKGFVRLDIKYLGSHTKGHHLKFTVIDTGMGIEQDKQKRIFSPFSQADTSTTRKYGGTGLGLIISKKLLEAMDGGIQLHSELGQGSEFFFDIYIPESNSHAAPQLDVSQLVGKRLLYLDNSEQAFNDIKTLFLEYTDMVVDATNSDDEFTKLVEINNYDAVMIGRKVSPNNIVELKQLVAQAKERCENVFAIVNSISPNLKEVAINAGARHCFSMPANHKKILSSFNDVWRGHEDLPVEQQDKFSGMKALIVDDMPANLKLIETLMTDLEVETQSAVDGAQALQVAERQHFDMIFMDIQMPIMDGITACQKIRESSLNEETPIIAVTAHAGEDEQELTEKAKFSGILTKPIDEDMLVQIILETCPNCQSFAKNAEQKPSSKSNDVSDKKITKGESPEDVVHPFQSHPHIDWALSLERAANKPELAHDMLKMLITGLPETLQKMTLAYEQKQIEELIKIVHKFHGACCYTGVPKLRVLTNTVESELKRRKVISDVEPELLELLDELANLIEDSKEWFESTSE